MSILVLGAGAWGTSLAHLLAENGHAVTIWAHRASVVASINHDHCNHRHLPELLLSDRLKAIGPEPVLEHVPAACLVAVPSQFVRPVLTRFQAVLPANLPLILACKGIELSTGQLMTEVAASIFPTSPLMLLSGPSFAHDVAKSLPTAVAIACDAAIAAEGEKWRQAFASACFRPYLNHDPIGVAIGGAVKNVIAIACGIATGRQLGANAHAGLLTRGLAEMTRLAVAAGGRAETMMGLAGLGDLALTCSNTQSRNMSLGIALGQGIALDDYCHDKVDIIEGIPNARAVVEKAAAMGVDMPICQAVCRILHDRADIGQTIAGLLTRPLKAE